MSDSEDKKNAKVFTALTRLKELNRLVFTTSDFRKMFTGKSDKAIAELLYRGISNKMIENPARGVYVNTQSAHISRTHIVYDIARALRRGSYTYLSLESALSEYGVISQIPIGYHTFMTSGRSGKFETPYGTIEFTHTKRNPVDFIEGLIDAGRPLPIASKKRALQDLRRVGRNTHLIQEEEIADVLSHFEEISQPDDDPVGHPVLPINISFKIRNHDREDISHAEIC